MKEEWIVLKFAFKMEVSLCQGFRQQGSLCATEEKKMVCVFCAVGQSLTIFCICSWIFSWNMRSEIKAEQGQVSPWW